MNQGNWISIVALTGWLVLAISAYRARHVGARKTIIMALAWFAIFLFVVWVFATVGG